MHVSAIFYFGTQFRMARIVILWSLCLAILLGISSQATPVQAGAPGDAGNVSTILPFTYAQVTGTNVPIYAFPEDAGSEIAPLQAMGTGFLWVSLADPTPIFADDAVWYRVNPTGYVRADQIKFQPASDFQGISLPRQPDKRFGWTVTPVRPSKTPGTAPAKETAALARYTPVTVRGEQKVGNWTWYQVGDNQWIEQRQVGLVKPSPRPAGVGTGEKWIEVDLYEQTLAAYEGDTMVYATLVSSGLPQWPTPTGLFRIWAKATFAKMSGREGLPDYYFLQDVPWSMYFDKSVALHGAYWHDRFGAPHSHGCVNLTPQDALWLFNWTTPVPGAYIWTLPSAEVPGTWVWVHE